ncbi:MAG: hypothetical protein WKG00_24845, partial [Polyangiaceae bacterium]
SPPRGNDAPQASWGGGVTEPLPTAPLAWAPASPAIAPPPRGRRATVVIGTALAAVATGALWLVGSGAAHPPPDAADPAPGATASTQAAAAEVPAAPPRPAEAVADAGASAEQGGPGAAPTGTAAARPADTRPADTASPRATATASARATGAGKRVFVPSDL